nr:unnamed protein product [Callosobruchus analis]
MWFRVHLSAAVGLRRGSYLGEPERQHALHLACLCGNAAACRALCEAGAPVVARNNRGRAPLHLAAASAAARAAECLDVLLDTRGVEVDARDADGRTPLHATALHGRFTRSKALLDKGALVDVQDKTTVHHYISQLHMAMIFWLIHYLNLVPIQPEKGLRVEHPFTCVAFPVTLNAVESSYKLGSYECLDLLVSNGAAFKCVDDLQRLPLHYAAAYGHYQCAFTLVGIGSPVNVPDANGCHPLHLAAAYDHEGKVVEYLLEHKADATAEESRGFSPLHYAIAGGNVNGVTLLISHYQKNLENSVVKKIVNKRSMDVTPLQLAILHALTPYYEDVNLSNSRGVTPLILAAREGHAQSVHFLLRFGAKVAMTDEHRMTAILLKCGADPNILDKDSHSCLFRAVVNGQNSIVQLLLSNNANVQRSDVNGKTVLHLAAACGHLTCMQMIMSCMTDEEIRAEDNQFCHANCVEYLIEKDIFKELHGNVFSPLFRCGALPGGGLRPVRQRSLRPPS